MIIDTMMFAYTLFKEKDKYEESLAVLEKADEIIVPDSFRAEFTNVAWQWVRAKNISEGDAFDSFEDIETLVDRVVGSEELWIQALQLSIESDHPAYDTLFVAAAIMHDEKVITYDKKLRSKFPDWVLSPDAFLAL